MIKMSIVELKNLSYEDIKKILASQIDIEDWTDECNKCGYPKLLHKELHHEAESEAVQRTMENLTKITSEFHKANMRCKLR